MTFRITTAPLTNNVLFRVHIYGKAPPPASEGQNKTTLFHFFYKKITSPHCQFKNFLYLCNTKQEVKGLHHIQVSPTTKQNHVI